MNPLFVVPLLAYTLAATLWPAQVDGRRRAFSLLAVEALFLIAALVAGTLLAPLATPNHAGLWWGRAALLATGYLYVSGRGVVLMERALALSLELLGEYSAVGWIIAAKSLARFKALEEREFAEYFLIGTLASFLLAVLAGVGLRLLLSHG